MELRNIASLNIDGQTVYYKRKEVIAIGRAARDFVSRHPLRRSEGEPSELGREVPDGTSALPPAFHFTDVEDPETLVAAARARGLRVQLNHVFFAHCGCGCDPCCAGFSGAMPLKATPLKATPLKATRRTTAVQAEQSKELKQDTGDDEQDTGDDEQDTGDSEHDTGLTSKPTVWILDTGGSASEWPTPIDGLLEDGNMTDAPDKEPEQPEDQDRGRPGDDIVDPVAGHGSFIAGIIWQVATGCSLHVYDGIDGLGHIDELKAGDKILQLVGAARNDLTRTILNLSFGGSLISDATWYLGDAIATAQETGVVVVASAGNDSSCLPVYPANFRGVTAVGAIDAAGHPAGFTNRGAWVDACALGVDIVSTFFTFNGPGLESTVADRLEPRFDGWAKWSGTSFAAPVVAAAIAKRMLEDDELTSVDARDAVLADGDPVLCLGVAVRPPGWRDLLEASSLEEQPTETDLGADIVTPASDGDSTS